MNKITEQQFYDLLSLKLSGDATTSELTLLQEQLLLHPEWQFLYDQMMQPPTPLTDEERTEQAFAAHVVKMQLQGKLDSGINAPIGYSTAPEGSDYPGSDYQVAAYPPTKKIHYRKLIFGGLAAAAVAAVIFLMALVEVLFAQAVAYFSFKQPLSGREIAGIALILVGVGLLVAS